MSVRFPLLVLLGIVFLASVSVSLQEKPSRQECLQSCESEKDPYRKQACQLHCKLVPQRKEQEEESREHPLPGHKETGQQESGHQQGEKEEKEQDEREKPRPYPYPRPHQPHQKDHEESGHQQGEKEEKEQDEREKPRPYPYPRPHQPHQKDHEESGHQQGEKEEKEQDEREKPRPYPYPRPHQPHQKDHEESGHQQGEKEEKEQDEREQPRPYPFPRPHQPHQKDHEESGHQQGEKEEKEQDEREQPRPYPFPRPHQPEQRQHEHEEERQGSESESESESQRSKNPYYFSSNRFHTLYKNQYGHIRLLQRFDQRSTQLQNLRDYRVTEFKSKPNTLLLPHHADADFMLLVLSGRAILTFVNADNIQPYNLERGDAQRIPAGTTFYLVNPDDKENLRLINLVMPVNKAGRYENFFLPNTQEQQSYLQGFSKNILEASYDTKYEEINRVLFGEEQKKGEESQSQEEGVIVKLSKEQIRELSKHAKPSSRKTISSEDEPFNLRSRKPIYSNKFGKFYEITPEKNPQLRDLDIFLSSVDINEGALLLPHYNSKAIAILVVNEGVANIELVGLREQQQKQQEQEEQETREVRRYRAELSEDDIFVVPADYPVVVQATSNLNFAAFGINAENNQRNFLAGEKDNVISQIPRQVKDLSFPGSAQDVEKLLKNQKESYFVDAQPQQKEEGEKEGRGPLSSIVGTFY